MTRLLIGRPAIFAFIPVRLEFVSPLCLSYAPDLKATQDHTDWLRMFLPAEVEQSGGEAEAKGLSSLYIQFPLGGGRVAHI